MNIRTLFLLPVLLCFSPSAGGQAGALSAQARHSMDSARAVMTAKLITIYTDSSETARFSACHELIRELVATLDRPNSFNYDFGEVPGLSIKYPQDSSFRIFTWELYVDRDLYRHYGAIQRNHGELALTPLLDRGDTWMENPENRVVPADQWLGYAVYDVLEGGELDGRPYYFLFGYDSYDLYRRRKVLDVLRFTEGGQPEFGLPIFDTYTDADLPLVDRARIILEFGAEATVALRYDEDLGGIVYENLVMMPGNAGEGPVNMPDGSYHMLKKGDDGRWIEEKELFNHIYEEAPREVPKPGEGRDILGRTGKGGGGR